MQRCNQVIVLSKDGQAVSYCQLDCGHDGDHSISNEKLFRCPSSNDGERCGQPIGHFGSHSSGGVVKRIWQ